MKKIILATAMLMGLCSVIPADAVRARKDLRTVTQPDGTTLAVKTVGDEYAHFTLTSDDRLVTQKEGVWYYATLNDAGRVVATDVVAGNADGAAYRVDGSMLGQAVKRRAGAMKRTIPQFGMGRYTSDFPRTGDIRGLVILVEYKDYKFKTSNPQQYFHDLLNKDGFSEYGATGCAAEYFRENSNNLFRPVFDVLGPVTMANNRRYYGGNDYWGDDKAPQDMVVEAVQALDPTVDFSKYDLDGDGYLDNVFIFYAGEGEASSGIEDAVWPHSWDLSETDMQFKADGVTVDHYACTNEWVDGHPDGVGTFIHEFSHVMGLPDLYDTVGDLLCTPGEWSVLDYGPYNNDGHTPPNYSVYERNAMGWLEPEVIDDAASITLPELTASNKGYIIQTPTETEFFLIENRQQTGWDKYLPGHGMLIWHVDFKQSVFDDNVVNNSSSHQYVEIEKANGVKSSNDIDVLAGWSWPGTSGAKNFTDDTTPSMKTWNGTRLGLPITDITERNGVITFDVAGGVSLIDTPVALEPERVGHDWFEAIWEPVEGATDYAVTVLATFEGGGEQEETNDMGSGKSLTLPAGWTSTVTDVYSTTGNYGDSSPSLKMAKTGASIQSPEFDHDIIGISFWYKGQQSDGSSIAVTGILADGAEVNLATVVPEKNASATYELASIRAGVRAVRLTYTKSKGNVALDDIVIKIAGASTEVVPGYNGKSTGGAESLMVTGLDIDHGAKYSYYVTATDGEHVSRKSNIVEVSISTGVVGFVSVDGIHVSGRTLVSAATPIDVYDVAGRPLARGVRSYTAAEAGVYIVRAGEAALKVNIR